MLNKSDLNGYQHDALLFLNNKKSGLLALDMGLGKSVISATYAEELLNSCMINHCLIVAPKKVALNTWPEELSGWEHLKDLTVTQMTGRTPKERQLYANKLSEVNIINRENLVWLIEFWGDKWPYDMLILDEAKWCCTGATFKKLKKVRKYMDRVVLLSGTPAPNGHMDLFGQAFLVDQGETLGKTITAYRNRYFDRNYMGYGYDIKDWAPEVINSKMREIAIYMSVDDHLDLPPIVARVIHTPLKSKLRAVYEDFKKEFITKVDDGTIIADSSAILSNKLLQFCISEGTPVLTVDGWVPIEEIDPFHTIWDGKDWVSCYGSTCNGIRETVECYGVRMTPNHKVLTNLGWKKAEEILDVNASGRFNRSEVRLPEGYTETWISELQGNMAPRVRMREASGETESITEIEDKTVPKKLWMPTWKNRIWRIWNSRDVKVSSIPNLDKHEEPLQQHKRQRLQKLWGKRSISMSRVARLLHPLLEGHVGRLCRSPNHRKNRQRERILQRELSLGNSKGAGFKRSDKQMDQYSKGKDDSDSSGRNIQSEQSDSFCKDIPLPLGGVKVVRETERRVFDLVNCGKRSRFVVKGEDGKLLIVHNCNGSVYDEDGEVHHFHDEKLDVLEEIVRNSDSPILCAYSYKHDIPRLAKRFPKAEFMSNDTDTVKRWNAGKIGLLFCHPASAGHGLNLQFGGNVLVWFGMTWSLELYQQFNYRLRRRGQKGGTVIIHHITIKDSIEDQLIKALNTKDITQQELLNTLRIEL